MPGYTAAIDAITTDDEQLSLQLELAANPLKGKLIKRTGGARKIRMAVRGTGKSGGARIVYYWQDPLGMIWLFKAYLKKDKPDLSGLEKNELRIIIRDIKNGAL